MSLDRATGEAFIEHIPHVLAVQATFEKHYHSHTAEAARDRTYAALTALGMDSDKAEAEAAQIRQKVMAAMVTAGLPT